jgi:hypothetical protein
MCIRHSVGLMDRMSMAPSVQNERAPWCPPLSAKPRVVVAIAPRPGANFSDPCRGGQGKIKRVCPSRWGVCTQAHHDLWNSEVAGIGPNAINHRSQIGDDFSQIGWRFTGLQACRTNFRCCVQARSPDSETAWKAVLHISDRPCPDALPLWFPISFLGLSFTRDLQRHIRCCGE